jgi:hypothetical protein
MSPLKVISSQAEYALRRVQKERSTWVAKDQDMKALQRARTRSKESISTTEPAPSPTITSPTITTPATLIISAANSNKSDTQHALDDKIGQRELQQAIDDKMGSGELLRKLDEEIQRRQAAEDEIKQLKETLSGIVAVVPNADANKDHCGLISRCYEV